MPDQETCQICSKSVHEKIDREINRLQQVMEANFRTVCVRQDEGDKALALAKNEMNQRLEGMNEFREELRRVQATFVNGEKLAGAVTEVANKVELAKAGVTVETKSLSERVGKLELIRASIDGKIIGIILIVSVLVQIFLRFGWPK